MHMYYVTLKEIYSPRRGEDYSYNLYLEFRNLNDMA